jgi:hypothetical protein
VVALIRASEGTLDVASEQGHQAKRCPRVQHRAGTGLSTRLTIGAVVAVSVKLMVLAFIMSLVSPVLGQLRFSGAGGELKLNEILSMILVAGMLAFTVWRAPGARAVSSPHRRRSVSRRLAST